MLFLFFVLGLASAQTCSDAGEGPCLNGACPTGTTCTNSATICCDNTMIATTTTPAPATVAGCTDSTTANCGSLTAYCSVAAYYTLMTTYCPATCGRCGVTVAATTTTTASSSSCVDLLNPSTGVSDCPSMASYCNNSVYYTVMTQQCPKTCARCSSTATTASSSCVDLLNPSTGVSDCPSMASYCNNSVYYTVMTQQCPKTCARCSSG